MKCVSPTKETVICVLLPGKHILLVICVSWGKGTHFTKDMCFLSRGTHITSHISSPSQETNIPSHCDMCSPTWETYIAIILVVGEHISQVICVSREGKSISLVKCVPGLGNMYIVP